MNNFFDFDGVNSFLMIGQSNMAGRGELNEIAAIDNDLCYMLRMGSWVKMSEPVNPDRPLEGRFHSGVGLASSFANELAIHTNSKIGLIPCADGGTQLLEWMPGSVLFDHAICQTMLALRSSVLRGILWHQGENDCPDDLYPMHGKKLTAILNAFRKRLNLYDVPFLLGGLGDFLSNHSTYEWLSNYVNINESLKYIASENEMTGFVSAEGLSSNPDNLHFSAQSLREFGIRYYNEFKNLEDTNKVFIEKPDADNAIKTVFEHL